MFVRRMIAHFRNQTWTAKEFTAIGVDLIIVVVGVFIATQVADWSAREADKRRGQAYIQQLTAEIESNQTGLEWIRGYYDAVYEGAVRANALLEQPTPDPRELVASAYRGTEYIYYATTSSTWDQIVSSGDMALIPNDVRVQIEAYLKYDSSREVRETFSNSPYRQIVRRLISYDVQDAIRAHCSEQNDASGGITNFPAECDLSGADNAEILASARALQRDPQVLLDLRYQISDLAAARANIARHTIRSETALAALQEAQ
jgi:hypothetical protein